MTDGPAPAPPPSEGAAPAPPPSAEPAPAPERRRRHALVVAEVIAVGLVGAILGLLVAGTVSTPVGPFQTQMSLTPTLNGSTVVTVPPLGQLLLDTHSGPVELGVRVETLRDDAARSIVANPDRLRDLGAEVNRDLRSGLVQLAVRTALVTVVGAALLGLLVFRRWRHTAAAAGTGLGLLLLAGSWTALTVDERALAEPRFTGLLASAPTAVGDVRDIVARFDAYSLQLGRLVSNVSQLYNVTSRLPTFTATDSTIRALHVSDLHLNPAAFDVIASVVEQFAVDVVIDTGDITDFGSAPEDRYVAGIASLPVPYVWIRGNHDSRATQAAVAAQPNAVVLDGTDVEVVEGLRFMGLGDPRFTPDRATREDDDSDPAELLLDVGRELAAAIEDGAEADVVLVHDPAMAGPLRGVAPLVLAGHTHQRSDTVEDGTRLLVEGSTGGAGLRALEGEEPTPIMLSVLYFDPDTRELQAYDAITLGGLGTTDARISRRVVVDVEPVEDGEEQVEVSPTPSPGAGPAEAPATGTGEPAAPAPAAAPRPRAAPTPVA